MSCQLLNWVVHLFLIVSSNLFPHISISNFMNGVLIGSCTFQELPLMHILTFGFFKNHVFRSWCVNACHGEVGLDCLPWSSQLLKLRLANQINRKVN